MKRVVLCLDCGKEIERQSKRCKECFYISRKNSIPWNKGKIKKYFCKDCKGPVSSKNSIRCQKCFGNNLKINPNPNSVNNLKPKSAEWLREHKIHLNHSHSKESKILISKNRKGKAIKEKNPRWNNGQSIKSTGYRTLLVETAKPHKFEHRIVMEKYLGRELKSCEVVHHIDHDRLNNEIDNLEVMSRSEHSSLHAKGLI